MKTHHYIKIVFFGCLRENSKTDTSEMLMPVLKGEHVKHMKRCLCCQIVDQVDEFKQIVSMIIGFL